jgi:hypothetical protein
MFLTVLRNRAIMMTEFTVNITTVLDSKPTKSVGHFEENKFSFGGHQFLLECCPKLIKTHNFGQNAVNKSQLRNKNEQFCALGCLFSKLPRLFVDFPSTIVNIFYCVTYPAYFDNILNSTIFITTT